MAVRQARGNGLQHTEERLKDIYHVGASPSSVLETASVG